MATGTVVDASPAARTAATAQPLFRVIGEGRGSEMRYAVRVDDRCRPVGNAPVVALRGGEEGGARPSGPAGLGEQLVHRTKHGGYVYASLNTAPERPLLIASRRGDDGACEALTYARIDGRSTLLDEVDVKRRFEGDADGYVELRGRRLDDGRYATERLGP